MNILIYSSLFPNPYNPNKCPFLFSLFLAQSELDDVHVVSPVPYLEMISPKLNYNYSKFRNHKIKFPLYFYIPKYFKYTDPYLMFLQSFLAMKSVIDDNGIDLIHSHYLYPDSYAAAMFSKYFSIPLVITSHGSDLNILTKSLKTKEMIRHVLDVSSSITTVSSSLGELAFDLCNNPSIDVIPNGVDLSRFGCSNKSSAKKELGFMEDDVILIGVGSFIKLKRFDVLIRAFGRLDNVNKKLILLGDGPEKHELKSLASNLGLVNQVFFPGWVPHELVPKYMAGSDILCISSCSEGWPTIIFEALACGCLVVGTPIGGIPEALGFGKYGFVVKNLSEKALFDSLSEAVGAFGTRFRGSLEYASCHDWSHIAERYRSVYRKVL